jgi:hypothetical protein
MTCSSDFVSVYLLMLLQEMADWCCSAWVVSQLITPGELAKLELVDSLDPFSEGIVFSVMPPKKSWKNISDLSGGEKVRCVASVI